MSGNGKEPDSRKEQEAEELEVRTFKIEGEGLRRIPVSKSFPKAESDTSTGTVPLSTIVEEDEEASDDEESNNKDKSSPGLK